MTRRFKSRLPCKHPLCTHSRPCPIHGGGYGQVEISPEKLARDRQVKTPQWERTRQRQLQREPSCQDCLAAGRGYVRAVDVHHATARRLLSPEERQQPAQLISLCKRCHSIRTQRGE